MEECVHICTYPPEWQALSCNQSGLIKSHSLWLPEGQVTIAEIEGFGFLINISFRVFPNMDLVSERTYSIRNRVSWVCVFGDTSDLDSPLLRYIDGQVYRWENSGFILGDSGLSNTARHRQSLVSHLILTSNPPPKFLPKVCNCNAQRNNRVPFWLPSAQWEGDQSPVIGMITDISVWWVSSHRDP